MIGIWAEVKLALGAAADLSTSVTSPERGSGRGGGHLSGAFPKAAAGKAPMGRPFRASRPGLGEAI